jgi:hypothetical protein
MIGYKPMYPFLFDRMRFSTATLAEKCITLVAVVNHLPILRKKNAPILFGG